MAVSQQLGSTQISTIANACVEIATATPEFALNEKVEYITRKISLRCPNIDYTAPLQQDVNPELMGAHPYVHQFQSEQRNSYSNKGGSNRLKQHHNDSALAMMTLKTLTSNLIQIPVKDINDLNIQQKYANFTALSQEQFLGMMPTSECAALPLYKRPQNKHIVDNGNGRVNGLTTMPDSFVVDKINHFQHITQNSSKLQAIKKEHSTMLGAQLEPNRMFLQNTSERERNRICNCNNWNWNASSTSGCSSGGCSQTSLSPTVTDFKGKFIQSGNNKDNTHIVNACRIAESSTKAASPTSSGTSSNECTKGLQHATQNFVTGLTTTTTTTTPENINHSILSPISQIWGQSIAATTEVNQQGALSVCWSHNDNLACHKKSLNDAFRFGSELHFELPKILNQANIWGPSTSALGFGDTFATAADLVADLANGRDNGLNGLNNETTHSNLQ